MWSSWSDALSRCGGRWIRSTFSGTSSASKTVVASASRRLISLASAPGVGRATPSTTARSPTPSNYPGEVQGASSPWTTKTGKARSSSSSLTEKSRPGYGSRPTGRSWKVTETDSGPCGSSGYRRTCSAPGTTPNASAEGPGSPCGTGPTYLPRPSRPSATTSSTSDSSTHPDGILRESGGSSLVLPVVFGNGFIAVAGHAAPCPRRPTAREEGRS